MRDIHKLYYELKREKFEGIISGEVSFRIMCTCMIHHGTTPESKIIDESAYLLTFLNEQENVPMFIKVAIGHYYFDYIHSFYDGNGRTSRFISSLYLA